MEPNNKQKQIPKNTTNTLKTNMEPKNQPIEIRKLTAGI